MSVLRPYCTPKAATQITPNNIFLVISDNDFRDCLEALKNNTIQLKFLEQRKSAIDIHLSVIIQQRPLDVTFRILGYSNAFKEELLDWFPSAAIYVHDIE